MLSCEQVDNLFIKSEQKVARGLMTKKIVTRNAYYGKIPDGGSFPLNSGTRIKGLRLGRIGYPDEAGWRPIEDELCSTTACDFMPEVISRGNSDYTYSLVARDLRTDWLCIDSMAFREMPADEIAHLEDGLQSASRYVHEEFRRSRFIQFGRNKIIAKVELDGEDAVIEDFSSCDGAELQTDSFVFEARDNGEMDESHIRVKVLKADIPAIAELSLDMLDFAAERLGYEDASYMDGTGLFDVLLCHQRIRNKMAIQEAAVMGGANAVGSEAWNMLDLRQQYGTEGVLRNYSLRTDIHAMRFYPDTNFNATLDDGDFDEADPNTWPRFTRVYPYVPAKSKVAGIEFVTNPGYLRAPFGISTILNPRVMEVMSFPDVSGYGSAKKEEMFGWEGSVKWRNPDWECNVKRNRGFWMMCFRLAARPAYTEEGYSYFHRISHKIKLAGNACDIPVLPCKDDVTPYCYEGMGGTEGEDTGLGGNAAIDN